MRHQYQSQAHYWNGRIRTWGLVGYQWQSYWYKDGKRWRQGWRQVPVYGWIHDAQAEANRNAMQQAANTAAQMRDAVRQQGQPQMGNNQGQIALLQQRIATLQQELQRLRQQQAAGSSP
ncbi:hypothetical protein PJF56_21665 [Roseofilum sp. BLCC_M91]|uniref:DUF5320 domain-containing protein n=1 Tax=Roseofilum halophilum BLCC-M91 TaxID=3022259 RepID=A0ABT7BRU2_9CYAN|nr:hypothetical protein [Roseofilum halophilum]MDJ1181477.1 hypothetical protein [Roseofilum halophilum BLCC-M91]